MVFIKPILLPGTGAGAGTEQSDKSINPNNPTTTWVNKAGNSHFQLQESSFTSGMGSWFAPSLTLSKSLRKAFRIILLFQSRNQVFVVALADHFKDIHSDWNWVEGNLTKKVAFAFGRLSLTNPSSITYIA